MKRIPLTPLILCSKRGEYRVFVPGLGASGSFRIAANSPAGLDIVVQLMAQFRSGRRFYQVFAT